MNQVEIKKRQIEICSYMLGMISLLVLGNVLGNNGIAYIAAASEGFLLFWTLTGCRVAGTLGKLLRNRSSRGQYKNVLKMKKNIMIVEGIAGLIGSILMLIGAPFLAKYLFRVPYSVSLLVILAPVIFLRTLSSVLLGYFQGEGSQMPTVLTAFLRQILVLVFALLFTRLLDDYGTRVSVLLRQEDFVAMYGGIGVAFGILTAELLILLFLLFLHRGTRAGRKRSEEGMRTTENFGSQVQVFTFSLFPQIVEMLLKLLPLWLGIFFFRKSCPEPAALEEYGVFCGKYLTVCGLIILPVCAVFIGAIQRTASSLRKDEVRYARNYFSGGLHIGVVHAFFFAVFIAILAPQIAGIFCAEGEELAGKMFRFGSFQILFAVLFFYFSELLSLTVNRYLYWASLLIYNAVYSVSLIVMLNSGEMGVMALVNAGLFSSGVYVVIAGFLLYYVARIRMEWLQSIAIPAGISCAVGLILLFLSRAIAPHLGNVVTIIVCLVLSKVVYWGALLMLHNFGDQELGYMPGGKWIRMLGGLLRIF